LNAINKRQGRKARNYVQLHAKLHGLEINLPPEQDYLPEPPAPIDSKLDSAMEDGLKEALDRKRL
jgi:hypothetical protein